MKTIRITYISMLLLLLNIALYAINPPALVEERLYISFKSGQMEDWVAVMNDLQREYNRTGSAVTLYELTHAQYGYIGFLIGSSRNSEARSYLRKAEANVERLLERNPRWPEVIALRGSFLAYHIALSPFKAPVLGPRSLSAIDQALSINSNSAQALIERGNAKHYAPTLFGGNPNEATAYYRKAINEMVRANAGDEPKSWQYLNTLTQLALAYEKAGDNNAARHTFRHILSIAPDYKWVAEELFPN